MTIDEIEAGFRKQKDGRLKDLNIAIAKALMDLGLVAKQSETRKKEPGDTLCFRLRKPKLWLVSNQFYEQKPKGKPLKRFLQFRWSLSETGVLGITEALKEFLDTTIGFGHPDASPKAFTKIQMGVNIYPDSCDRFKSEIPRLMDILRPVLR